MVIALLFVSLLSGLLGVACAVTAGGGVLMGLAGYMAGGTIGSMGFVAFAAIRCTPAPVTDHSTQLSQPNG